MNLILVPFFFASFLFSHALPLDSTVGGTVEDPKFAAQSDCDIGAASHTFNGDTMVS
jgi:hypothetical protein